MGATILLTAALTVFGRSVAFGLTLAFVWFAADNVGGQATAENALQGSLVRLFAVAEAYPDLKANKNFLDLQQQLAEVEDQLQMARRYYNGAVRNLNIGIQSFPAVLLARPFGFREEPFFELDDRSQATAPQVSLGGKS
jgi:LemA protein